MAVGSARTRGGDGPACLRAVANLSAAAPRLKDYKPERDDTLPISLFSEAELVHHGSNMAPRAISESACALLLGVASLVGAACDAAPETDGQAGGGGAGPSAGATTIGVVTAATGGQTSTTTTTHASSSSTGGLSGADALGLPCTSDGECGPLKCIAASSGELAGDGPQGGLCTKTCTTDAACDAVVSGSLCLSFGGTGFCALPCSTGSSTPKADKCRGRDDTACSEFFDNGGNVIGELCQPTCSSDAGCGAGLYCDYGIGLCTSTQPVGLPIGADCDPYASDTGCASEVCVCANQQCTVGLCTGYCVLGTESPGCGGPDGGGVCGLTLSSDPAPGDLGVCSSTCDCDADCANPYFACNTLLPADQQATGHPGMCFTDGGDTIPVCCSCDGKVCGSDGCGASCGTCPSGKTCVDAGACCADCAGKTCGPDGCGGTCGTCPTTDVCTAQGTCMCVPDCTGKVCGPDGCGGTCGACGAPDVCDGGACCTPDCAGKACGSDGCGGTCGSCASNQVCNATNQCQCQPSCAGKNCGPDGCGGMCGSCSGAAVCNSGSCCTPNCAGKNCGSDGCGGTCGSCGGVCQSGVCCQETVPCSGDYDCCGNRKCGLYTAQCYTCFPLGEFCGANSDCCTGACNSNQCNTCLNDFQDCENSSQCCNHFCGPGGYCQ